MAAGALHQAEAGEGAGDGPEYPLSDVLRKNKGTLSVVAEYKKILKSGGCLRPVTREYCGRIHGTVVLFLHWFG